MATVDEMLGTGYGGSGGLGADVSPIAQSLLYGAGGYYGNPYGLQGAYGGYQPGQPMTNYVYGPYQDPSQPMENLSFDQAPQGFQQNTGYPYGTPTNTSPQSSQTTGQTGQGGGQSQTPGPSMGQPTQAGGQGSAPVTPAQNLLTPSNPSATKYNSDPYTAKWLQVNNQPAGSWAAGMSYNGAPISAADAEQLNRVASEPNNPTWFNPNAITQAMQGQGVPQPTGGGAVTYTHPPASSTPTPGATVPGSITPIVPSPQAPASGRGSFYATNVPVPSGGFRKPV